MSLHSIWLFDINTYRPRSKTSALVVGSLFIVVWRTIWHAHAVQLPPMLIPKSGCSRRQQASVKTLPVPTYCFQMRPENPYTLQKWPMSMPLMMMAHGLIQR